MTESRKFIVIALCFLVAVLEGFDLQVIAVAGPQLREAMNLAPQQLGWMFSASVIGLAVGSVIGGVSADRFGRKPVLIVSVAVLGVLTVLTALAWDFTSLMTLRILGGVTIGAAMPNLIAMVADVAKNGRVTSSVAIMICGMPAGGILVALVGHAIAARYGWQSLFLVGGILPLLTVPALIWGLVETKTKAEAVGGVPFLTALFGGGRLPSTLLLWAVFILTLAMLSIMLSWTPTLVVERGLPPPLGYSALLVMNVGGIAGSLIIGWLCDRIGVRAAMIGVYVAMAASLLFFAGVRDAQSVLLGAGAIGFAVLGAQFALYGVAPRLYALAYRGAGVGAAVAAGRVGSVLGPVVAGNLLAANFTQDEVIRLMAPLALIAGLALILLTAVARSALAAPARAPHERSTPVGAERSEAG